MAYGDDKQSECRMYTAVWGFFFVNLAAVCAGLLSLSKVVGAWPGIILGIVIAAVGNPCVVLAAWGDCIDTVTNSVLGLFKRNKEAE